MVLLYIFHFFFITWHVVVCWRHISYRISTKLKFPCQKMVHEIRFIAWLCDTFNQSGMNQTSSRGIKCLLMSSFTLSLWCLYNKYAFWIIENCNYFKYFVYNKRRIVSRRIFFSTQWKIRPFSFSGGVNGTEYFNSNGGIHNNIKVKRKTFSKNQINLNAILWKFH